MANIKIVYIATDKHYSNMFDKWIRNLEFFAQEDVKNVVLLTNEVIDVSSYNLHNIRITKCHIMHFPWPIITLFKFHLIYNHIDENDDYVFYFNCNFMPFSSINILDFETEKIYFFRSNKKYKQFNWEERNPYNNDLKYVVGTVIGGGYLPMKKCCEFIINHVSKLLEQNQIEYKHDESALNHYVDYLYRNNGKYVINDFEDLGELDYSLHNNGDKKYHKENVNKYVLE